MNDVEKFLDSIKKSSVTQTGEKHEIRVPQPDKEWAKQNGAKWDDTIKSFVFYSDDPNSHTLAPYMKSSKQWLLVPKKLPYDSDGVLRRAGVVSEKLEDQWVNYVLGIEKYAELIGTLNQKGYL